MRCLLFFQFDHSAKPQHLGFTLIELLVVIFVLASIAGVVIIAYEDVGDQAAYDTAKYEMAEIRKALLQFRRDSGSQNFPNQGIYDCTALSSNAVIFDSANGADNWPANAPSAQANQADWEDWCASQANFWMLFNNPKDDPNTNAIEEGGWNVDTHRGWNGPYIQNKKALINYAGIDDIPSVITPFQTPYLLFNLDTSNASIVSMGENDTSGTISDCGSTDEDDFVVCLLK